MMKKSRVALAVFNSSGQSLTVAGLTIQPFEKAPEGEVFYLPLSDATTITKALDVINVPIKYDITPIEAKSDQELAFEIASVELGVAQVIADNLIAEAEAIKLKVDLAGVSVSEAQAVFNDAQDVLESSRAKASIEVEAKADTPKEQKTPVVKGPVVKVTKAKPKTNDKGDK